MWTFGFTVHAAGLSIVPETVHQGEPVQIIVDGPTATTGIKKLTFDGSPVNVFMYNQKLTAFYGVDINKKAGNYKVVVNMADGSVLEKTIAVKQRPRVEAPLGIPEKLGGNTPQAEQKLVTSLVNENDILNKLWTNPRNLWVGAFIFPVEKPVVTDPYGYQRLTGAFTIAHKGTDFRALEGTSVKAMNRGVARLVKTFNTYGNTVVVDHGMGLMTFYMHLSKVSVVQGQLILLGMEIGKSGQTGYAEGPHLHVSVRLNNTSIDPMKFMEFFKQ